MHTNKIFLSGILNRIVNFSLFLKLASFFCDYIARHVAISALFISERSKYYPALRINLKASVARLFLHPGVKSAKCNSQAIDAHSFCIINFY